MKIAYTLNGKLIASTTKPLSHAKDDYVVLEGKTYIVGEVVTDVDLVAVAYCLVKPAYADDDDVTASSKLLKEIYS